MIDRGLLLTMVVIAIGVTALVRLVPPRTIRSDGLFDRLSLPLLAGVAAARLTAVALDDPSAIGRVRDLLLIRGGMELWAGLLAAALTVVVTRPHEFEVPAMGALADLAPYVLCAIAVYEGACVLRDGCFGPASSIGLRPAGVGYSQLPVGLGVAAALSVLALAVRKLGSGHPLAALVSGVGGLAAVRSVAAVWLPRVSAGLTRQHRESLVVLAGAVALGLVLLAAHCPPRPRRIATVSSSSGGSQVEMARAPHPTEEDR